MIISSSHVKELKKNYLQPSATQKQSIFKVNKTEHFNKQTKECAIYVVPLVNLSYSLILNQHMFSRKFFCIIDPKNQYKVSIGMESGSSVSRTAWQ